MLSSKARFFLGSLNLSYLVRCLSSDLPSSFFEFNFKPKFSNAEEEKILNILNQPDKEQLLCLNVARNRIKSLENYKKKNGPFKSLNELLEVDGLSVRMLEKLCRQIIDDTSSHNTKPVNNENKKIKQIVTPPLPTSMKSISSAVGIHLAPMGVSWAKIINSDNYVESWGYQELVNFPKKMYINDTFKLVMNILTQIPTGDVYVFEGLSSQGLQVQKQASTAPSYTQQLELCSMLLALINTSVHHNILAQQDELMDPDVTNCVYFLRSKVPARMFKTLVGYECVSSTATILQLLGDSQNLSLPCSPITFDRKLKNHYLGQSSAHKELLGQALMLTIAFMELCVKRNPASFKSIAPRR